MARANPAESSGNRDGGAILPGGARRARHISGVGKTHLAIALGVRACSAGYSVRYIRAYERFRRFWAAMADNTFDEVLDEFADPDLSIVDDLTHSPRKPEEDYAAVFYELVQRRCRRGSFITTSTLGFTDLVRKDLVAYDRVGPRCQVLSLPARGNRPGVAMTR